MMFETVRWAALLSLLVIVVSAQEHGGMFLFKFLLPLPSSIILSGAIACSRSHVSLALF